MRNGPFLRLTPSRRRRLSQAQQQKKPADQPAVGARLGVKRVTLDRARCSCRSAACRLTSTGGTAVTDRAAGRGFEAPQASGDWGREDGSPLHPNRTYDSEGRGPDNRLFRPLLAPALCRDRTNFSRPFVAPHATLLAFLCRSGLTSEKSLGIRISMHEASHVYPVVLVS